jgi:hypothetical protein
MHIEIQLYVSEAVLMQIEVHSSVAKASEKSHNNAQLRRSFSGPKFKAWNFQICGRRFNHLTSMLSSSLCVGWNRTSGNNPDYQIPGFLINHTYCYSYRSSKTNCLMACHKSSSLYGE